MRTNGDHRSGSEVISGKELLSQPCGPTAQLFTHPFTVDNKQFTSLPHLAEIGYASSLFWNYTDFVLLLI